MFALMNDETNRRHWDWAKKMCFFCFCFSRLNRWNDRWMLHEIDSIVGFCLESFRKSRVGENSIFLRNVDIAQWIQFQWMYRFGAFSIFRCSAQHDSKRCICCFSFFSRRSRARAAKLKRSCTHDQCDSRNSMAALKAKEIWRVLRFVLSNNAFAARARRSAGEGGTVRNRVYYWTVRPKSAKVRPK